MYLSDNSKIMANIPAGKNGNPKCINCFHFCMDKVEYEKRLIIIGIVMQKMKTDVIKLLSNTPSIPICNCNTKNRFSPNETETLETLMSVK